MAVAERPGNQTHGSRAPATALTRAPAALAGALCLAGFAAAARVSTVVFDRLPHVEDEVTFLFQAQTLARGHLMLPAPAHPEFFPIPFIIVRGGEWYGKYPPGWPAVLALGALAGQPWLVNPLLGALSLGLTFLIGRRLFGPATGLLAAALLLSSPFFLLQSGSFMSHTAGLCLSLVALYAFIRLEERRAARDAVLLGAAFGALFLTRPLTALGIGAPFVVWGAAASLRRPACLRGYLLATLAALPFVLSFLLFNRLTTGDPFKSAYQLWWPVDRVGFGHGIGADGNFTLAEGLSNTRYEVSQLSRWLFGWPLRLSLAPSLLALASALRRRSAATPWVLLLGGMAAGLIAVHVAYWNGGPYAVQVYGPRYYFEATGALALLSAHGLARLASFATRELRCAGISAGSSRLLAGAAVLLLAGDLTMASFGGFTPRQFQRYTRFYNIDGSGVRQLRAAHLHYAVVFVSSHQVPYAWPDLAPFFASEPVTLDGDVVYAADLGDLRDQQLMADYPDRAAYRYKDGKLTPL